jgi:hypothetical protein
MNELYIKVKPPGWDCIYILALHTIKLSDGNSFKVDRIFGKPGRSLDLASFEATTYRHDSFEFIGFATPQEVKDILYRGWMS